MKGETKDKIMQAALENMARLGFKGMTTKALAQFAGVNETTIFKHFRNKDVLINETLEKQTVHIMSKIDTFFHANHQDIRELLIAKIQLINEIYEENKHYFIITFKELGSKELEFIQPTIFEYLTQELENEISKLADNSMTEQEIKTASLITNSALLIQLHERVQDDIYERQSIIKVEGELLVDMLVRLWRK